MGARYGENSVTINEALEKVIHISKSLVDASDISLALSGLFAELADMFGLEGVEVVGHGVIFGKWSKSTGFLVLRTPAELTPPAIGSDYIYDNNRLAIILTSGTGWLANFEYTFSDNLIDESVFDLLKCVSYMAYSFIDKESKFSGFTQGQEFFLSKSESNSDINWDIASTEDIYANARADKSGATQYDGGPVGDEADEAMSRFLANISHEIRTPIHSITGFLQLLRPYANDSDSKSLIDVADDLVSSVLQKVNFALDLVGYDYENADIEFVEFDLVDELKPILKHFTAFAVRYNVLFRSHIAPDIPLIMSGDSLRIKKILQHTINNAIKLAAPGSIIELEIGLKSKQDSFAELSFVISNRGKEPLNKDQLGMLIIEASIVRKYLEILNSELNIESNGVRVSAVFFDLRMKIVKDSIYTPRHDKLIVYKESPCSSYLLYKFFLSIGCSGVSDFPRDGTMPDAFVISVFHMDSTVLDAVYSVKMQHAYLPILVLAYKPDEEIFEKLTEMDVAVMIYPLSVYRFSSLSDVFAKAADVVSFGKQKKIFSGSVLVVEDNPVNSRLITIILNKYGVDVTWVKNGREAVDVFSRGFDLILMDINMPIMDGITATIEIRKLAAMKQTFQPPIVALTANISENYKHYIESGMQGVLAKPIVMERLEATLKRYLN